MNKKTALRGVFYRIILVNSAGGRSLKLAIRLKAGEPYGLNTYQNEQNQNKTPSESSSDFGDLGGSRTRVVGMKTRCTNRYTTRPQVYYSKKTQNVQA